MDNERYFDRDGKPISMDEWVKLFENKDYVQVAYDEIEGVVISTVWLGLNHRYVEGAPLIFETMVFGGDLSETQERYSTLDEASAGHAAIIERVKASP